MSRLQVNATFFLLRLVMGAALVQLKATFVPDVFQNILIFLDRSSHVAVCGPEANDIAIMSDLDGFVDGPFTRGDNNVLQTSALYRQTMSDDWNIAWRGGTGFPT